MYDFILQTIVMASLAVLIYLAARAVPRVSELPAPAPKRDYVGEIIKQIPFEKIDASLNSFISKFLRKAKVFVLKLDNSISANLNKFKPANNHKESSGLLDNSYEQDKNK